MPFLSFEPSLFGGTSRPGRLAFTRNYQRAPDELDQALFGQITVSALASHVTRDNTDATVGSELRGKLVEEPRALIVGERAGRGNILENLDARRSLVDVLTAGARRSRNSDVQLVTRDRERIVDRQKLLGGRGRWGIAHLVTASETA